MGVQSCLSKKTLLHEVEEHRIYDFSVGMFREREDRLIGILYRCVGAPQITVGLEGGDNVLLVKDVVAREVTFSERRRLAREVFGCLKQSHYVKLVKLSVGVGVTGRKDSEFKVVDAVDITRVRADILCTKAQPDRRAFGHRCGNRPAVELDTIRRCISIHDGGRVVAVKYSSLLNSWMLTEVSNESFGPGLRSVTRVSLSPSVFQSSTPCC